MLSFLDLPESARTLVYEYALVRFERNCPIDLSYWQKRSFQTLEEQEYQLRRGMHQCWRRANTYEPHNRTCVCEPLPLALLRVCRTVHSEAVQVLYSENKFVLRGRTFTSRLIFGEMSYDNHHDDYRLQRLPPAIQFAPLLGEIPLYGLANMRSLLIRLNCWPCPLGHEEAIFTDWYHDNPFEDFDDESANPTSFCRFCNMRSDRADDPLFLTETEEGAKLTQNLAKNKAMLKVWDDVCEQLGLALKQNPHDRPQLDLTFICDVDSAEDAERVVAPLKQAVISSAGTRLRNCTIRLGRDRQDADYTAVARRTVQTLKTGVEVHEEAGDITDTRHIFPFKRLPAELRIKILEYTDLGRLQRAFFRNGRQFFASTNYMGVACCNACTFTRMDCCCPRYYSSVSVHCKCAFLPTELFKVDRQMYHETAQDMFYSKASLEYHSDNFDITLQALKRMTPNTLKLITKLKFVVSTEQFRMWRKPGHRMYVDSDDEEDSDIPSFVWTPNPYRGDKTWAPLVAFISDNMDVSRLSIRLNFIDCVWDKFESYLMSDDTDDLHHEFHDAYCMYMDLVNEVCTLEDLKGFAIDISVFENMEHWFVRQVLGDRDPYKGGVTEEEIEKMHANKRGRRAHRFMPVYHSTNIPLPNSSWVPPVEMGRELDTEAGAS
ncbi:hypothetical protein Sste5346_004383 [Sporothrix stenoceras]|uniref:DUF7730 domain-containing protein n=1 Tax=Sporothrix stenoceras TaxID=5173 RepID=A0ABR3Z8S9_9PEZI